MLASPEIEPADPVKDCERSCCQNGCHLRATIVLESEITSAFLPSRYRMVSVFGTDMVEAACTQWWQVRDNVIAVDATKGHTAAQLVIKFLVVVVVLVHLLGMFQVLQNALLSEP